MVISAFDVVEEGSRDGRLVHNKHNLQLELLIFELFLHAERIEIHTDELHSFFSLVEFLQTKRNYVGLNKVFLSTRLIFRYLG